MLNLSVSAFAGHELCSELHFVQLLPHYWITVSERVSVTSRHWRHCKPMACNDCMLKAGAFQTKSSLTFSVRRRHQWQTNSSIRKSINCRFLADSCLLSCIYLKLPYPGTAAVASFFVNCLKVKLYIVGFDSVSVRTTGIYHSWLILRWCLTFVEITYYLITYFIKYLFMGAFKNRSRMTFLKKHVDHSVDKSIDKDSAWGQWVHHCHYRLLARGFHLSRETAINDELRANIHDPQWEIHDYPSVVHVDRIVTASVLFDR